MPEMNFSRYRSKGQINAQQPSFLAPEDTTGQILEKTSQIASNVQEMAFKWQNAVDTVQKTTASANFKSGMLDILSRAEADPEYNNSEAYFKEIEKLKSESLKGFSSKAAEAETALNFGYEAKVGQIQIQNLYRKKTIDVGQASTMRLLDMESKNPMPGFDKRIKGILGNQVRAGILDHKSAYELEQKYTRQWRNNAFMTDVVGSPVLAEENLAKNVYGFDVKEAEAAGKILAVEKAKIQAVTENQLLVYYLNGTPPEVSELKELMKDGKIDAKFAEAMIGKITNPKPSAVSQDTTYIEFQNKEAELLDKEKDLKPADIAKFLSEAMQAHSAGLLDESDVQRVVKNWGPKLQEQLEGVSEKVMDKVRPKSFLERISFWSDEYADKKPDIKARMFRRLVDGMGQGESPDLLLSKIIDDEIEIQMSDNLKKPDRIHALNPETKKRAYSDDGGATWFDEKTGKEIK